VFVVTDSEEPDDDRSFLKRARDRGGVCGCRSSPEPPLSAKPTRGRVGRRLVSISSGRYSSP